MNKKQISLTLGVVCAILVFAIFTQIKTVNDSTKIVGSTLGDDSLRDEVLRLQEKYENMYQETEKAEESLENARKKATENDTMSSEIEEKLNHANLLLGKTELQGQGVVVTMEDNKTVSSDTIGAFDSIDRYLVHATDILNILNELKNAGAEAISVNDQRIVSTSAVICIGNVVSINGERVGAPYIINAIGNPESLYGALTRPESYLKILNNDGVIASIKKSDNIIVPKYTGTYNTENIEESK